MSGLHSTEHSRSGSICWSCTEIFTFKNDDVLRLTEDQWEYIKCFLQPQPRVGRKRAEDRKTINGIIYVLETGCKWEDMPRRYGILCYSLEERLNVGPNKVFGSRYSVRSAILLIATAVCLLIKFQ